MKRADLTKQQTKIFDSLLPIYRTQMNFFMTERAQKGFLDKDEAVVILNHLIEDFRKMWLLVEQQNRVNLDIVPENVN